MKESNISPLSSEVIPIADIRKGTIFTSDSVKKISDLLKTPIIDEASLGENNFNDWYLSGEYYAVLLSSEGRSELETSAIGGAGVEVRSVDTVHEPMSPVLTPEHNIRLEGVTEIFGITDEFGVSKVSFYQRALRHNHKKNRWIEGLDLVHPEFSTELTLSNLGEVSLTSTIYPYITLSTELRYKAKEIRYNAREKFGTIFEAVNNRLLGSQ
jgi:hypothetical protein